MDRFPWVPLADDDRAAIAKAYEVLTRIGQATAAAGDDWDYMIDRAHQELGVVLAVNMAQTGTGMRDLAPRAPDDGEVHDG